LCRYRSSPGEGAYNIYPGYFPYFFPFLFLSTDAAEGDKQKTNHPIAFGKNHQTFEHASIAFDKNHQTLGDTPIVFEKSHQSSGDSHQNFGDTPMNLVLIFACHEITLFNLIVSG
jgi:hypothetical protein